MEDHLHQTSNTIPSCQPNSSKTDITLGLPNRIKLVHCPQCNFYLHLPKVWIKLKLQSNLLLLFCFDKFNNYLHSNKLWLLRAEFITSESNSKTIKIRFYVKKEVINGQILQHSYLVEFLRENRICEPCSWVQANPNQWFYIVELRQHRSPASNLRFLERFILNHGVAADAVRIDKMKHGTDFCFAEEDCARELVDFIKEVKLVHICESKEFVSHDKKSSYYSFGYAFLVQVCSICHGDLIFLPPYVASSLGNIGPIMICTELSDIIGLFDPLTSKQCCLDGNMYWREPFQSLLTRKDLVEYVVLNVGEVYFEVTLNDKKFGLANAEVARVEDLGTRFKIKTHLGYVLERGDYALGYDLCGANCSVSDIELKEHIGDGVILIKKRSEEEKLSQKRRAEWSHLKDIEKITNEVFGMSLGSEEPALEEKLGDLNLCDEEYKEKKKARRMA